MAATILSLDSWNPWVRSRPTSKRLERTIADALVALETERRYGEVSADLSPEFQQALPDCFAAGIREIIDDGFVREASRRGIATGRRSAAVLG